MNQSQINTALRSSGYSAALIAKAMNKTTSSVTTVISRKSISKPIATAIATILKKPVEVVFNDVPQYQPNYSRANAKAEKVEELKLLLTIAY